MRSPFAAVISNAAIIIATAISTGPFPQLLFYMQLRSLLQTRVLSPYEETKHSLFCTHMGQETLKNIESFHLTCVQPHVAYTSGPVHADLTLTTL